MTISEQATNIVGVMQKWLQGVKGDVEVCYDLKQMWEVASQTSDKVRVLITYGGEEIRGEFAVAAALGRVDCKWIVALVRGRGFNTTPGLALATQQQNAPAFYDQLDDFRNIIRSLIFDPQFCELPVDFKNVRPIAYGNNVPLNGYMVEFTVGTQLPALLDQPEELASAQAA